MSEQGQNGYSGGVLLLAAGSSALAGLALGYALAKKQLNDSKGGRRSPPKLFYGARLGGSDSAESTPGAIALPPCSLPQQGTPLQAACLQDCFNVRRLAPATLAAATPRSLSRQDSALGSGLKMVLLVRTDLSLSRPQVAEQAARAVLGAFKKQFKRRDPNLRLWEEGGHRIKV